MKAFSKRRYGSLREFGRDLRAVWGCRNALPGILRGKTISAAFRERLILAVTGVNRCRYCSFAHTKVALREGMQKNEIDALFQGALDVVPEDERAAVLYAQHWAENAGQADPETTRALEETYGAAVAGRIQATLQFIYLCNLTGNTADWMLHAVSLGALGGA